MHRTEAIGRAKVASARDTLAGVNPETNVEMINARVAGDELDQLVARADVVLDGCDNFATRHAVNRACVKHKKPLVSGAGVRFDGQVSVFDMRDAAAPCYACLFPEDTESEEVRCAVMGVFAPLTGIVGCIQAAEALKIIIGAGTTLAGRLLLIDALTMDIRTIKLKKDAHCAVCARP